MQDRYDPKSIEPRWQDHWAKKDLFRAGSRPGAPKKYVLAMLPYPSGEMHMGHARVYSITDVLARYARKRGFDVLHPFGWDSFGLPAENAAIKEGVHPAVRTPKNIKSFKEDVISMGISVDWSTELATSDPGYYKWNQWFFLRMLERGLVYRRRAKVNYCPV
ncbi:MAG: class I tRNA ligase family protein, partial [Myxococcales bacterium]|nr:class I tRNA ligase family protein [Myxococcales bacterium]